MIASFWARAVRAVRPTLSLLLGLTLVACGGGGGGTGGGSTPPPAPPAPTFTADYVPLASGDRRSWRSLPGSSVGDGVITHERVGDATTVAGQTAFPVADQDGDVDLQVRTSTGLVSHPSPTLDPVLDPLGAAVGPVEWMRFGLSAGGQATTYDRSLTLDLDRDGRSETLQVRVVFRVIGFEALTLPLASFPSTARVSTELTITGTLASGASAARSVLAELWFVQGIGQVRSITTSRVGAVTRVDTEELIAYGVGGQRSESTPPTVSGATPEDGSAVGANLGRLEVRFSEPLDPLALREPLRLLNAQGQAVPSQGSAVVGDRLIVTWDGALADGRYTVSLPATLVDLANNPLAARVVSFQVDTTGPQLVGGTPAPGSENGPLSGTVSMQFNEPVRAAPGGSLTLVLQPQFGTDPAQRLPATLNGNTVSATLQGQLVRDAAYSLTLEGALTDLSGNAVSATPVLLFRTEYGPLGRPTALAPGLSVKGARVGDLDGDGRADLVLLQGTEVGDELAWRPGLPAGGFGPARSLVNSFCFSGSQLLVGDVDGDGRNDVVFSCGSFLRIARQQANGSFVLELAGWNGGSGYGLLPPAAAGGVSRLVVFGTPPGVDIGSRRDAWQILTRSDAGWQGQRLEEDPSVFGRLVADFDNDGFADLLQSRRLPDGSVRQQWLRGSAAGFAAAQDWAADDAGAVWVEDLDGDGLRDTLWLALDNFQARVKVRWGRSGAVPQDEAVLSGPISGLGFGVLGVLDVDGDGRRDLLVQHGAWQQGIQLEVLLQTRARTLEVPRNFRVDLAGANGGMREGSMAVVDLDGDGRRELLLQGFVLSLPEAGRVWPLGVAAPRQQRLERQRQGRLGVF